MSNMQGFSVSQDTPKRRSLTGEPSLLCPDFQPNGCAIRVRCPFGKLDGKHQPVSLDVWETGRCKYRQSLFASQLTFCVRAWGVIRHTSNNRLPVRRQPMFLRLESASLDCTVNRLQTQNGPVSGINQKAEDRAVSVRLVDKTAKPGLGPLPRPEGHGIEIVWLFTVLSTEDRIANAKKIINLFQIIAHKNIFRQVAFSS